ncbi:hypothetical protein BD410DRAFT_808706 [Rickenella mellea]|uniref:Uncharacterized protein n=1 Tax=Rickenella mellea TaxID=50990 RepID=A0A4Y7PMA5_9AGAM|nr:hypothetical protein BD410DRAFT_808706 [Rickenella mellea]
MAEWPASIPGFGRSFEDLSDCFYSNQQTSSPPFRGEPFCKQRPALERIPTEIIVTPPVSPSQPNAETMLKQHGIKVRDFGFEPVLPPVPTVHRKPRTTSTNHRGLKRSFENSGEGEPQRKLPKLQATNMGGFYRY